MFSSLPEPLLALAAAAVLQRARWDGVAVDIPLALPVTIEPDEIVLELASGAALVLASVPSAAQARADLRRWGSIFDDAGFVAVLSMPEEARDDLVDHPPDRPTPKVDVVLIEDEQTLWDRPLPAIVVALLGAAEQRPPAPEDTADRLRERLGLAWPPRATPPATPAFERIVHALAQAHDLVSLDRGHASLKLRGGGTLEVLASTEDEAERRAALVASLATLAYTGGHLLVVDGPSDLAQRVDGVLGPSPGRRVHAVLPSGDVEPPDPGLRQIADLAQRYTGPLALQACLDAGRARSQGLGLDQHAHAAGETRLGLVAGLLEALPAARLQWVEGASARIGVQDRELRIRWVGPGGADVDEVVRTWRLAVAAAKWTGHAIDLVVAGGDSGTWERARRAVPSNGNLFHLDQSGRVRTQPGVLGRMQPTYRALRALAKHPAPRTVEDLRHQVEQGAVADFRAMVVDAEFHRKLFGVAPWATRILMLALVVGYALQIRFDATSGPGATRMGALTGEGLLLGEPWRWLAAAFLHAGIWHIALNAWALWILGRRLEAMIGPHRFVVLFLLSCVGGSVLHEAFSSPGDIAVGASTGILGLLAAQGALVFARPDLTPPRIRRLLWREAWVNGLLILAISLLPFVGGLAHLGGALTGAALIASGLLTWGVRPGDPQSQGPTQVGVPSALVLLTALLSATAAWSFAISSFLGEPWVLQSPEGRVRDRMVAEGALTLPVPGGAVILETVEEEGRTRRVHVGDPLRDGLRIDARAAALGIPDFADLDLILALRGAPDRTWERTKKGDGPTAWSTPTMPTSFWDALSPPDRLQRRTYVMLRDGIWIEVEATGTADLVQTRLSGTWDRIPGGVSTHPDAWPAVAPAVDLAAFDALLDGSPLPSLKGIEPSTREVLKAAAALRDGAPPTIDLTPRAAARALTLAPLLAAAGRDDLALALLDVVGPHARGSALTLARVHTLEEAHRFDEALRGIDTAPGLVRAQLLWNSGRSDEARIAADQWLQGAEPWWTGALGLEDAVPAQWRGNQGWARFLAGDPHGCVDDTQKALRARSDLVFARYNLGLCTLATGDLEAARAAYRRAEADARAIASPATRRAGARDLLRLVRDDVAGAAEIYVEIFADLMDDPRYDVAP